MRLIMSKRAKYRAKPTNGYASKLESRVADMLRQNLMPGEVLTEQVAITFACGAKYVCDFAVMRGTELVRLVEAKGIETPVWRLKLRMLKHEWPELYEVLWVATRDRYLLASERGRRTKKVVRA